VHYLSRMQDVPLSASFYDSGAEEAASALRGHVDVGQFVFLLSRSALSRCPVVPRCRFISLLSRLCLFLRYAPIKSDVLVVVGPCRPFLRNNYRQIIPCCSMTRSARAASRDRAVTAIHREARIEGLNARIRRSMGGLRVSMYRCASPRISSRDRRAFSRARSATRTRRRRYL